jgi:DNA-binding NarL/FixJ family response regulator
VKVLRVLLADDHSIVRQGLRSILEPDGRFEVVGEAGSGTEALELAKQTRPDVVLLDLKLPDMSGVEVCQRLLNENPETVVLILTAFLDRNLVDASLKAGAKGYLLKDADQLDLSTQLIWAIRGHSAMDLRAVDALAGLVAGHETAGQQLNARELQVLRHVADGLTNKEIASRLELSTNTVKWYVQEILSKLGARNRVQAAILAKELGLL